MLMALDVNLMPMLHHAKESIGVLLDPHTGLGQVQAKMKWTRYLKHSI